MAKRKIPSRLLASLEELGLSGSEAAVYAYLVQNSPATGYRIAQAIGKPVANTYKTIASLETRGALVIDDSGTRQCSAVAPEEFLARLESQFRARRTHAAKALADLRSSGKPEELDPRVYQVRSRQQVIERARAMLSHATRCALVDAFPSPLEELAADIDRAAERGIDVVVKSYTECHLKRATMIPILQWEREIPALWPGHHLHVVVDAADSLLALLEPQGDGVVQAFATSNTYLAAMQHSGMQFEFITTHLRDGIYKQADHETLRAIVRGYLRFSFSQMPGYKALLTGSTSGADATGPRETSP